MTFKINGRLWKIEEVDMDSKSLRPSDVKYTSVCDFNNNIIYISDFLNEERFSKALKYELTHAVLESNGFYAFTRLNLKQLCEFTSCHAHTILQLADEYMTQRSIANN